ncbi:MAG: hypothetical protein ACRDTG_02115 [Pseudonocardiaceae bacterium]
MKTARNDIGRPRPDHQDEPLTRRGLAMLRAVSDGRAELVCSCEPDLLIDGLGCCDQFTAHRLAGAGLIRPVVRGAIGERVRAELTVAGRAALNRPLISHESQLRAS